MVKTRKYHHRPISGGQFVPKSASLNAYTVSMLSIELYLFKEVGQAGSYRAKNCFQNEYENVLIGQKIVFRMNMKMFLRQRM
jgi:hypothetical protein